MRTSVREGGELFVNQDRTRTGRIAEQRKLLLACSHLGCDLDRQLASQGLGYDDLLYEHDYIRSKAGRLAPDLDAFSQNEADIPVLSFFSGCGGLDLGFEATGFAHLGSIEINAVFCDTLRLNRPRWTVLGPPAHAGDVSNREELSSVLSSKLGVRRKFDGIFLGGPPCQPFSIAANQRFSKSGANFKRIGFAHTTHGNLLFDFIWFIDRFRPRAFLIENVPGLADLDDGEQLSKALRLLSDSGYKVDYRLLNAQKYSVPQQRNRLFVIGARGKGAFSFPKPASTQYSCGPICERSLLGVANHVTRKHTAESVLRYMSLDYGQRDQLGRVDRLNPDLPSKTIIAGGAKGGGRSHLHPYIPRTLSVRESARLQGFPDSFHFSGPAARQFTQVGNAVPPVLAAQLAKQLRQAFFS